jgi:glycosyltransferase involved in cell wall biosynthesis
VAAPTFSAVIAAYNAGSTVQSAMRSVIAQTDPNWEMIVVDDGSTDDTCERVRELEDGERIRCLTQSNQGPGAARNLGIAQASGKYVSFLDSDDLWMPTYLEQMGAGLESHPQAGLAYTDAWSLDDGSRQIHRATAMSTSKPPEDPLTDHEQLLLRLVADNFILTSATVRRDVLGEVGSFDPSLAAAEDYELWLRIVRAGHDVVRPPGLLAIQRDRPDSLSKSEMKMTSSLVEVMRRVEEDESLSEAVRSLAAKRKRNLDRRLSAITGTNKLFAGAYRLRNMAARGKWMVLGSRPTFDTPPDEVASAYPDLTKI